MKTMTMRVLLACSAFLIASAVSASLDANDSQVLRQTKGTYEGTGRLKLGGESISGDVTITMPRRRGTIAGVIDPGGIDEKFTGRVHRVVCRRRVVVYYGKLRFEEGGLSVTGDFRGKARLRGNRVRLSIPFSFNRDVIFDTIRVEGRIKGLHI